MRFVVKNMLYCLLYCEKYNCAISFIKHTYIKSRKYLYLLLTMEYICSALFRVLIFFKYLAVIVSLCVFITSCCMFVLNLVPKTSDHNVESLLDDMEAFQTYRMAKTNIKSHEIAQERILLAKMLFSRLEEIEQETGIFLIKPYKTVNRNKKVKLLFFLCVCEFLFYYYYLFMYLFLLFLLLPNMNYLVTSYFITEISIFCF